MYSLQFNESYSTHVLIYMDKDKLLFSIGTWHRDQYPNQKKKKKYFTIRKSIAVIYIYFFLPVSIPIPKEYFDGT